MNAGNIEKATNGLASARPVGGVAVVNSARGMGPRGAGAARSIVQQLTIDLASIKYWFAHGEVAACAASFRTGYTGEDGRAVHSAGIRRARGNAVLEAG